MTLFNTVSLVDTTLCMLFFCWIVSKVETSSGFLFLKWNRCFSGLACEVTEYISSFHKSYCCHYLFLSFFIPGHLAALDGEVVSRKGALRVKIDFDGHLVDVVVTHLIGEGGHEKIKTAVTYVVI